MRNREEEGFVQRQRYLHATKWKRKSRKEVHQSPPDVNSRKTEREEQRKKNRQGKQTLIKATKKAAWSRTF